MLCSEATIVNSRSNGGEAITLRCKCWHCQICRPENAKIVRAKARKGQPTTLLTLTVNPQVGDSPEARARMLVGAFKELRRLMLRHLGLKRIPFLAVFERTKRGEPHLHVLCRVGFVSQRWISEQMGRLIGAPIVDIRRIRGTKQAAAYVAKYLGKDPAAFPGCKRYWSTTNWLDPWKAEWGEAPRDPGCWIVHREHFWVVADALGSEGWEVEFVSDHYLRFGAPP